MPLLFVQSADNSKHDILFIYCQVAAGNRRFQARVQAVYAVYMNRLNTSTLASEKEIEPVLSAAKKYLAESDAQKLNQPANVLLKEVFERSFPRKKT